MFGAAGIQSDWAAGGDQLAFVGAGQIRADGFPTAAFVTRAEDVVAGCIEYAGVVGREQDRECPGKAVGKINRAPPRIDLRPYRYQADLLCAMVVALERAAAAGRTAHRAYVDDVGVLGVHGDITAFACAGRVTITPRDRTFFGRAGYADTGVVLLGAIDTVRVLVVYCYMVKLAGELIIDGGPGRAAVKRDAGSAVVAFYHAQRILWVDPEVMVVTVGCCDLGVILAAVAGFPHFEIVDIDRVGILRIGEDMAIVPGALDEIPVIRDLYPGRAGIVRTIHTGAVAFGFDNRPHAVGRRARNSYADLAFDAGGQTGVAGNLRPSVAAIDGFPDAAVGTAAGQRPKGAIRLVNRSVEDARVGGV